MKSITFKAGLLIFVSIIFAMFSFYGYQIMFTANLQVDKEDTYLTIREGMVYKSVIDTLKARKILHDELSFQFLAKMMGYQEKVIKGRYLIRKNAGNFEILKALTKGRQSPIKLAIHNVRVKRDLAERVAAKLELSVDSVLWALNNDSFCAQFGFDTNTVLCMMLPNTYEFYWDASLQTLFGKIKKEYDRFWTSERIALAKELNLKPNEIIVLASIVEAETIMNDEKPIIAGVYLNRLKKGQKLQADPTVKFAVGDFSLKRILNGHLAIESPYNTYKYLGLPPGPINIPSLSSIEAVLHYQKHEYYYFCADFDKPNYHKFTKTFEEHKVNANEYRDELDQRNIK